MLSGWFGWLRRQPSITASSPSDNEEYEPDYLRNGGTPRDDSLDPPHQSRTQRLRAAGICTLADLRAGTVRSAPNTDSPQRG